MNHTRTIGMLTPHIEKPSVILKHSAGYDDYVQAQWMQNYLKVVGGMKNDYNCCQSL